MIRWVYAFIDRPYDRFAEAAAFWTAVTGTTLSPRRGDREQFATLLPPTGDAYLKLQGVGDQGGAHLDLEVPDVRAAIDAATGLGADLADDRGQWATLRSPAGLLFCLQPPSDAARRPTVHEGSRLDQVCLDIGPAAYEKEAAFWQALTGWTLHEGALPEFCLLRAPGMPVRILLQRLGADRPASAHLDMACADPEATRVRHERQGAALIERGPHWIVMRDPAGGVYCLTGRAPETGSLPA